MFLEECRVTSFDREITLSPKEFKLLELFMKNPKRVWSRDLILEKIWEIDFIGDTKTVDVHVRYLTCTSTVLVSPIKSISHIFSSIKSLDHTLLGFFINNSNNLNSFGDNVISLSKEVTLHSSKNIFI